MNSYINGNGDAQLRRREAMDFYNKYDVHLLDAGVDELVGDYIYSMRNNGEGGGDGEDGDDEGDRENEMGFRNNSCDIM